MLKRRLILCVLAGALALALTGCGDGKVQSTVSEAVSKIGEDIGETMSRVESGLDGGVNSRTDWDNSSLVSNPDYASSGTDYGNGTSGVNSGDWVTDGLDSDLGNLDSDLADDGIVGRDESSALDESSGSTRDR